MKWLPKNSLLWLAAFGLASGLAVPMAAEAAPTSITVTGAGKGANAYRALAAVAEVVNRNSKMLQATNRESGGFVEGTRLVARNRVQIAMSSGPFVDFWQRKLNPFERDTGARDTLRGIGPSGDAILQLAVLKDGGLKTFADLKGKRVSLGPKGSNSAWMIEYALKKAGLWEGVRKDSMNWNDAATYMVDRKLDAFGIPNPLGAPAILQASYSAPIRILTLPDDVIQAFIDYSKGYYKKTYKTNLYKGMEDEPFTTVVYMSMLVSNTQVPNDVVYEVTRHTYDPKNADLMVNIAVGWKSGLEQAKDPEFLQIMQMTGMKTHPGAARYWKEKGFKVD
ncbi:MAG: TAXI family TRAP transporter solute-binding subunit [Candidatus Tectomicrobia bacterium]|uniref:TAXI family TRAP transporter solute-binding subunit n=1 Tax=Tectimicrobiota bacterium TaxID=2528274 RepID=A0A932MMV7_UNCTE|nr:TAXI family TRAP transporter solute-binding subunit [Candidatus Tectomicrobia bacterium]